MKIFNKDPKNTIEIQDNISDNGRAFRGEFYNLKDGLNEKNQEKKKNSEFCVYNMNNNNDCSQNKIKYTPSLEFLFKRDSNSNNNNKLNNTINQGQFANKNSPFQPPKMVNYLKEVKKNYSPLQSIDMSLKNTKKIPPPQLDLNNLATNSNYNLNTDKIKKRIDFRDLDNCNPLNNNSTTNRSVSSSDFTYGNQSKSINLKDERRDLKKEFDNISIPNKSILMDEDFQLNLNYVFDNLKKIYDENSFQRKNKDIILVKFNSKRIDLNFKKKTYSSSKNMLEKVKLNGLGSSLIEINFDFFEFVSLLFQLKDELIKIDSEYKAKTKELIEKINEKKRKGDKVLRNA